MSLEDLEKLEAENGLARIAHIVINDLIVAIRCMDTGLLIEARHRLTGTLQSLSALIAAEKVNRQRKGDVSRKDVVARR